MGRVTTHVLNTAQGIPAVGLSVTFRQPSGASSHHITNSDGRLDSPLAEGVGMMPGTCELEFDVGAYFAAQGVQTSDPPFFTVVTIRFTVADVDAHYHVPLLVSPWSYSTYRGS